MRPHNIQSSYNFDNILYFIENKDWSMTVFFDKQNEAIRVQDGLLLARHSGEQKWIMSGDYTFNPKFTTLHSVERGLKDQWIVVNVKVQEKLVPLIRNNAMRFLESWFIFRHDKTWAGNVHDILYIEKSVQKAEVVMKDGRRFVIAGDAYDYFWAISRSGRFWNCGNYSFNPELTTLDSVSTSETHWLEVKLNSGVIVYDDDASVLLRYDIPHS